MSLSRFTPQAARAFQLPMERPGPFLRCVAPWLVVAIVARLAQATPAPGPSIGFILQSLAIGTFATAWMRQVALDEQPVRFGFSLRAVLVAVIYQVALMFESFPRPFLELLLDGIKDGPLLAVAGVQIFQLLIGCFFLVLPHVALSKPGEAGGNRLQLMVLAGGLGVGLGYVLCGLPFLVMNMLWDEAAATLPTEGLAGVAVDSVRLMISFAGIGVASAFFAQVWMVLQGVNPFVNQTPPAETEADSEPKAKRTERLNKLTKTKK
ncbi:conserved membrane hypothetical protein [Magnetospirillum sp. LM-5]|uniref:hypothetical protein n=1 Tax=Magnetospirillum sp. LM-5 TaxID=2681466 RepID=UPI0013820CC0|nr:hypothetical protein [Magnetospirillum sp. LM-5]CAA7625279.1 conserved membrane hypothetical protein [Magnetospirillum sp. LM-5]